MKASPWLTGTNPRDEIMPEDGDDGFFPITGNDLVSLYRWVVHCLYAGSVRHKLKI